MTQPLHILVVDDDNVDRKMIRRHLLASDVDLHVDECSTAEATLEYLRDNRVDCIILDYNLPELNGIEFLIKLHELATAVRPAVVMMTGSGNESLVVEAMRNGVKDYLVKSEITRDGLLRAVKYAVEETQLELVAEEESRRLEELAVVDSLTRLGNRHFFDIQLDHALHRARRQSESICLLYMDLDGFKEINDTHGHLVGDQVLREVGRRLTLTARDADTVVRLGGDEFAVIMETGVSHSGAEILAHRIEEALSAAVAVEDGAVNIGVSLGIAHFPEDGDCAETLIQAADSAMYGNKNRARDNAVEPIALELKRSATDQQRH